MTDAPPPLPAEDDQIDGVQCDALLGAVIDYQYSGGRHYRLTFDHDFKVEFEWVNHPTFEGDPGFEPPALAYRAKELRPGLYLVGWLVKEFAIHVALLIDIDEKKLHVSAMMPPNRWEFWDTAEIFSAKLEK